MQNPLGPIDETAGALRPVGGLLGLFLSAAVGAIAQGDPRRLSPKQLEESSRNGHRLLEEYATAAVSRKTAARAEAVKQKRAAKARQAVNEYPDPRFPDPRPRGYR